MKIPGGEGSCVTTGIKEFNPRLDYFHYLQD